jgi:hypothetical protein
VKPFDVGRVQSHPLTQPLQLRSLHIHTCHNAFELHHETHRTGLDRRVCM